MSYFQRSARPAVFVSDFQRLQFLVYEDFWGVLYMHRNVWNFSFFSNLFHLRICYGFGDIAIKVLDGQIQQMAEVAEQRSEFRDLRLMTPSKPEHEIFMKAVCSVVSYPVNWSPHFLEPQLLQFW